MADNLCNNIPFYGLWCYSGSYVLRDTSDTDYQNLVSYVVPIKKGITYTIYFATVGTRLRIVTSKDSPFKLSSGTYTANNNVVLDPTFSAGYKTTYTAQTDDNYLILYVTNDGTLPNVVVSENDVNGWIEPNIAIISKVEAESGTLSGSAVIADRASYSGNIVVDGLGASYTGSFTVNFNVSYDGVYGIKTFFTQQGDRDFKFEYSGATRQSIFTGTSYYEIASSWIMLELSKGDNAVTFSGYATTYAPMFDYFELYTIKQYVSKYLIHDNDTIYTVTDGALTEVTGTLNAQLFQDYGVEEIPSGTLLMTLSNPEVLAWNDSDTVPTLTATVKGVPHPQIIVSEEINLMDGSIKGINGVTIECKGEPIFAVSFDKKATWIMHNGTEWVAVSDELSGMTKAVFEAITTEQWQPQYETASNMYIRCTLIDETQSITTVNVDFVN